MTTDLLKDCLLSLRDKTTDVKYAHGLFVGSLTGLMFSGLTFPKALQVICRALPKDYREECIPDGYRMSVRNLTNN